MFGSSAMESYFREIVVSIRRNAGHSFSGVAYRQAQHKMLWCQGRARYASFHKRLSAFQDDSILSYATLH